MEAPVRGWNEWAIRPYRPCVSHTMMLKNHEGQFCGVETSKLSSVDPKREVRMLKTSSSTSVSTSRRSGHGVLM